jgi:hypothetical protein
MLMCPGLRVGKSRGERGNSNINIPTFPTRTAVYEEIPNVAHHDVHRIMVA